MDERYRVGWADMAYGLNYCSYPSSGWKTPKEWAKYMRNFAIQTAQDVPDGHPYYNGVIACATAYLKNGAVPDYPPVK